MTAPIQNHCASCHLGRGEIHEIPFDTVKGRAFCHLECTHCGARSSMVPIDRDPDQARRHAAAIWNRVNPEPKSLAETCGSFNLNVFTLLLGLAALSFYAFGGIGSTVIFWLLALSFCLACGIAAQVFYQSWCRQRREQEDARAAKAQGSEAESPN